MKRFKSGNKHFCILGCSILLATLSMAGTAVGADFPLRAKYPSTSPIGTEELASIFERAVIVDSRNQAEFDVIHIVGARNILVGRMEESELLKVRAKQSDKPLIFYCNGVTCSKSYKGAEKAGNWGFAKVRVYDAGIFAWAKEHPEKTEFFGKPLTAQTLETSLISDERFNAALLPASEFLELSKDSVFTTIDIRDPNEKSEIPFTLAGMKTMSFDTFIRLLNKESRAIPRENLLIVDNVGKQVRWLQYYLEQAGVKNYHFLDGGVRMLLAQGLITP